ncbi:MAG: dihydrolipoyl dehydrogenase family protein [Acidimicrobiales bacterium]
MDHDLIIVGGGAGGLAAARAAMWAGVDVALINDGPLGGDCTFTGCVPSKTLLAAARDGLEFEPAMKRVRSTIETIAAGESAEVLSGRGVKVITDRARLVTHDSVEVGGRRLGAPRIILATGSRAAVPQIPGLETAAALTNESVFSLTTAPRSLGIIGAGPVGCELAQAFAAFGVTVVLIEALARVLPREEPEASALVAAALTERGADVRVGQGVDRVEREPGGRVCLVIGGDTVIVDELLVAAGRVPNSAGMGLEELGLGLDDAGHIETDDRLATTVRGVYAVGDVTGKLPFTHAADEMGRLAAGNALRKGVRGRFRTHWIPWAIFTDPEVARVGMTEHEAADHDGRVAYLPLSEMDRAVTDERTDGYIKLIAGPRRVARRLFGGRIIGATIVAPRAGEMIHEAALAMRTGMFAGRLAQTVHAYPTWSYGIQKAAGQLFGDVDGRSAGPALQDRS